MSQAGKDPRHALSIVEKKLANLKSGGRTYWELALQKAQVLEQLNRREEALMWLRTGITESGASPDVDVLLIRERAAIESALGQFHEADRDLLEAIRLAQSSGQARMEAVLEIRRARVLIKLDKPEQAEEMLARAEDYVRAAGDRGLIPYIRHYQGDARAARNGFEDAVAPLQQSLEAFRQAGQKALAANVAISLAWCYYRLGQVDKALALYQEALGTAAPEYRHLALGHIGNIFYDREDYAKAEENYRRAAALAKGQDQYYYSQWMDNLATVLIDQGKCEEAAQVNREVLRLEEAGSGLHQAQVNLGRIEACEGHDQRAEQILRQVAGSRDGDFSFPLDAYAELAGVYAKAGKTEIVRQQFDAALALVGETSGRLREDENKLSYLSRLIALHQKYVDFLMNRGDQAGAFAVAESSRARLLRERLNLRGPGVEDYGIARYKAAAGASSATFLAYWIGPEHSYLWAISGARFASYTLPPERELRPLVEQYQAAIERGGPLRPEEADAGAKLFQLLLPREILKPGSRYLIVPDGPLYALNFETLPVPGVRPHFWIEDATVAVAPSLAMLLGSQARPVRTRSLLLVGDAADWDPEYPRLLNARREMDDIERLFPAAERKVLRGAEATPAAYERSKPQNYAFIHFTAHATANKNSPFDSAIILSQGKLSVKQVLASRIPAELVTISACHSAGARTYWGEGLVGFAWAFLQSGAHGVIAGLWDVSDYASPRLMQKLYDGLAAGKRPADALRDAKLELLHSGKYSDPADWGSFQLYLGTR